MARSPRGGLHAALGVAFAAAALTGVALVPSTLFTPGYFPVLTAHIVLGLLVLVAAPLALALHLKRTASPAGRSVAPVLLLLLLPVALAQLAVLGGVVGAADAGRGPVASAVAAVSVWLWGTDGGDGGSIGEASLLAMILLALSAGATRVIREREPSVPVRLTGVVATAVVFAALTTGLLGFVQRGDFRFDAYAGHSLLGVLAVVATVAHLKAPRRWLGNRFGPVVFVAVLVAVTAAWSVSYRAEHRDGFRTERIAEQWALRSLHDVDGDSGAPLDPATLTGSASCGEAGCHAALTQQWSGSAHRFAADNHLYLASAAQLVQEQGAAAVRFCAGCHDPVRALAGTVEADYADGTPPPGEGVSCVVCHVVVDHPGDAHSADGDDREVRNGNAIFRQPLPYPGADDAARARQIKLDPRYHRQTFAADVTVSSTLCGSCHRLELGPAMGAALPTTVQNTFEPGPGFRDCDPCHLPTNTPLGLGMTRLYDHHMAGINTDLALYARLPSAADPATTAALDEVKQRAEELSFEQGEGLLDLAIEGVRRDGQLQLKVSSSNRRIGHAFPLGPFDLREVWQEVVVRDAGGAVVWQVGQLDGEGVPDPAAPRLGAIELDRAGHPLQRHRVWDVADVRSKRLVQPGKTVIDRHLIAAEGPLSVQVRWLHRRTNLRFSRWALGDDFPGFPVRVVGEAQWSE